MLGRGGWEPFDVVRVLCNGETPSLLHRSHATNEYHKTSLITPNLTLLTIDAIHYDIWVMHYLSAKY